MVAPVLRWHKWPALSIFLSGWGYLVAESGYIPNDYTAIRPDQLAGFLRTDGVTRI
jgi:hypothetical protein